ncbi:hypothetical protein GOP47_0023355 [Adiantum capillus-veneris]|uniref:Uncharacterized protein n=1 Tax=Adiantum capillus-veneris TaxID=13818 RepID=A0A9D4Z4F8_ADICA|nr:hypothetical protein GOP47_0023355 [Adiantum capillus-veneris]
MDPCSGEDFDGPTDFWRVLSLIGRQELGESWWRRRIATLYACSWITLIIANS